MKPDEIEKKLDETTQELKEINKEIDDGSDTMTSISYIDAWELADYYPLPALVKMLVGINVLIDIVVNFIGYTLSMFLITWICGGAIAWSYSFVFGYINSCVNTIWNGYARLPKNMVFQLTGNPYYNDFNDGGLIKSVFQFVVSAIAATLYMAIIK